MSLGSGRFGTPSNKLNQSTDGRNYIPSHLFPTTSPATTLNQEDTYLTRNPKVNIVSTTPTSSTATNESTPKPADNDAFKYYLAATPYKPPTTPSHSNEKSPSNELPPARSVYEVIHQPNTGYLDTSMGDADTSFSGGESRIDNRLNTNNYSTINTNIYNNNNNNTILGGENSRVAGGYSDSIDWEGESRLRTGPFSSGVQGPFAGAVVAQSPAFAGQVGPITPARSSFYPVSPIGAQSPPFARILPTEESVPQTTSIWLTVFGFPPNQAASNVVLKYFQDLGNVVEYEQPIGSNWLHVCYYLKPHAERALSKNGKLIGEFMVGVILRPYDAEGRDTLPVMPNTITAKDPSKMFDRSTTLLPPKEQSWIKSIMSFTFG